jgi:uncharacterized protein (UPF0332 family)
MNSLIIYVIKAALYLSAFYLVYALLLSRDTSYRRNRAYTGSCIVISFYASGHTSHFPTT